MPAIAQTFLQKWTKIKDDLNLQPRDFTVLENSVRCTLCDLELTAVTKGKIEKHIRTDRHQRSVAARNNPRYHREQAWQRIVRELELSEEVYRLGVHGVVCRYCEIELMSITRHDIRAHHVSKKHCKAEELNASIPRPSRAATALTSPRENPYWVELCDTLLSRIIPLEKLRNPIFKNFLEKWTRHVIPDPTTLRDSYVQKVFDSKINSIRQEVGDHPISLTVDETTDVMGRKIANAVVTPLLADGTGIPRLVHCDKLPAANGDTIVSFVIESLNALWPEGIHHDRVLLYNTDAAPYMVRSARLLTEEQGFNKLVHVTCLAHGLHRVVEHLRDHFDDVNDLIAETKQVFLKAPARVNTFHELAPGLRLPPQPIVTRWGTWLAAAEYYASHFHAVSRVIASLDPDAGCVRRAQRLFTLPTIEEQFHHIADNYSCIRTAITRLEKRTMPLNDAIQIVEEVFNRITNSPDVFPDVKAKIGDVLNNNTGYATMKAVNDYLQTGEDSDELPNWSDDEFEVACHAPLVSCEVERTFSIYKKILADDRQSLLIDNLVKYLIVACYRKPI